MICASLVLLQPLLSLTHWIFGSLMLPYKSSSLVHPLLSLTHWIFRSLMLPYKSSSLVQNVFAVHRFAQGMAAASPLRVVDCRWRGNKYKVSVTGLAFVSLWRPRHFERRYKPVWFHSFMEPVKGSPQISLQNAALRQSVQHRVSFPLKSHCRMLPCGSQFSIEYHFCACPRTPFPAARAFPSRGNKG